MILNFRKIVYSFLSVLIILLSLVIFLFIKKSGKKAKDEIRITFREGLNIHELADLLQFNGVVKKQDFFEACASQDLKNEFEFLKNESKDKYFPLEGYLFPDTYDFLKNENPLDVIKKFLNNFKLKTSNLKIPEGFNLEQILIIASILEAESNLESSKDVSSVIHNRINTFKTGGRNKFGEYGLNLLQLESTMYYPYRTKEEVPDNFHSIYNTYEIKGLPPGPINSPGIKFIIDATNPNITDFFYFCNDKNGKIYFSKTYNEHYKKLKDIGLR